MTATFGTNANNDIYIGPDGNLVVLTDLAAIEAACVTATRAQLGEMIYEQGRGIPNFELIWVGSPDYVLWQSYIQKTLLAVDGVLEVTSLTLSLNNNTISYKAAIRTPFGTGTVNG